MNLLHSSHWEATRKQRLRSFCSLCEISKIKIRTASSIADETTTSTKAWQNVLVKKSHDDCDKSTRSRIYKHAIQFQIKKTIKNSRSIRLTRSQSKYTVWTTFRQRKCWFCKNWSKKKQSLSYSTIESTDHLQASRIVNCSISNKQ